MSQTANIVLILDRHGFSRIWTHLNGGLSPTMITLPSYDLPASDESTRMRLETVLTVAMNCRTFRPLASHTVQTSMVCANPGGRLASVACSNA